ncbi:hypothetical protein Agub_g13565 [Astrephomene gubernaculifera]|uniref:Uncharacterized protein n=1 Tax=Astrephomene gubernaculifera TaxID=47775 RepID=A0AAD3E2S1_9CHLO|nr:hypothetical protein Agub_g13565 [Astrephomene gubernaculifera]
MDQGRVHGTHQLDAALSMRPRAAPRRHGRPNTDTVKLLMLGYKQELAREFTLFNTFGGCFNMLSTFTSIGGAYGIGVIFGGPVVMMWGWLVVTLFTASVALSMAELASAYPTSGALYYWSYKLAPPRLRNLACWTTAWTLILGQAGASASVFYTFVHLLATAVEIEYGFELTPVKQFVILLGLSVLIAVLNCGTARLTAYMTTLGAMWHLIALAALCLCVPLLAPAKQSASYIFTSWQPNTEITGITSPVYTALVGLLMSQWCLTGFDGVTHLAEETFHAEWNIPRAIVLTLIGVAVTGCALLVALLSVKLDVEMLLDVENETHGTNVLLQILIEIGKEYGSIRSGVVLSTIPIVGTFFCANQVIANNSRMLYAFARDNGVPFANFAKQVHSRTKTPVCAVVYMIVLVTLIAIPMCFNYYVFLAVTSFGVVGCYIAYALPVLCKLSTGRRFFLPGPFFLGPRLSYVNNVIATLWVLTVTVLFTLPQFYPITLLNLNWAAPILIAAFMFCFGWYYFPKYGARYWFLGPRANLGQFKDELPSERARKVAEAEAAAAAAAVAASRAARAAAEATELMTRVARGSCGGRSPTGNGQNISRRSSRHSGGKSRTVTPCGTGTGALPAEATTAAAAVAVLCGVPPPASQAPQGEDLPPQAALTSNTHTSLMRTPISGASSRRHSAMGLMYGAPSTNSGANNINSFLLGMGPRAADDSGVSTSGIGVDVASSEYPSWAGEGRTEGRVPATASRRTLPRSRIHSQSLNMQPLFASTGGTGGLDRNSGLSRDRLSSLLMFGPSGSSTGAVPHLLIGEPLLDVAEGTEGGEAHEGVLDSSSLHTRARIRRASVSVLALLGAPAPEEEDATVMAGDAAASALQLPLRERATTGHAPAAATLGSGPYQDDMQCLDM